VTGAADPVGVASRRPGDRPATDIAIAARTVHKSFRLPHETFSTVKERVLHPRRRHTYETLTALDDVSFDIRRGEFVGIVGRNGSGKSTLLKCLSGIYRADAGEIHVEGRLAPFVDLGVGFNPEMSAAENAVLNSILLGMRPKEARERLDEVIAFAELEQFVDQKLKNLSTGMHMRLGFGVTTQVAADVLVFDEVLAVGDAGFQRKCLARLETLRDRGHTVLLVTHDMDTVREVCDRALLLDAGHLLEDGPPERIARLYEQINAEEGTALRAKEELRSSPRPPAPERRPRDRVFGRDLRRIAAVTTALAVSEFRVRYLESPFSYLWVMMGPLAFFAILYAVFSQVGAFDQGVTHYPLYLLTSLVLWTYFATATSGAVDSLVRKGQLLRKLPLPHVAIPLSRVLGAAFDLLANLVVVVIFLLAVGIEPRLSWLELPVIAVLLSVFATGAAMALSALYVRYRDIDQIWVLARQALFYGSPILYVVALLPENLQRPALCNPLAAAFTEARHALIDPSAPSAAAAIGGSVRLLIPLGIVLGTFAFGLWIFRRESPLVVENL
jgi:ABC-type polysaccharide/polyol phosphate transport system ATPase subunit/ABC-type polysaccharide/polyol phosphate export permease